MATIKAQGLFHVADSDFDPDDGDQYEKQLFLEKQSFVYSVLVTSLQTDKRRLVDVADPDFNPDDRDQYEKQLFLEKQSFVYSVLVTSLQTDKGRELV